MLNKKSQNKPTFVTNDCQLIIILLWAI